MSGYVVISDFVYETDKYGREYGWGIAEYSCAEGFFGREFCEKIYSRTPEQSYERMLAHLKGLFPEANEKALQKLLG